MSARARGKSIGMLAATVLAAVALAGCGDDKKSDTTTSTTTPPSAAPGTTGAAPDPAKAQKYLKCIQDAKGKPEDIQKCAEQFQKDQSGN